MEIIFISQPSEIYPLESHLPIYYMMCVFLEEVRTSMGDTICTGTIKEGYKDLN